MELGDYVGIAVGVGLAGTWFWVLRRNVERHEKRRKLAIYAFGVASLSVVLDLMLMVTQHFHQNPDDALAAKAYLLVFRLSALAALIGLVLGLIAKGTPRIAAVLWSVAMLTSAAFTMCFIANPI